MRRGMNLRGGEGQQFDAIPTRVPGSEGVPRDSEAMVTPYELAG